MRYLGRKLHSMILQRIPLRGEEPSLGRQMRWMSLSLGKTWLLGGCLLKFDDDMVNIYVVLDRIVHMDP